MKGWVLLEIITLSLGFVTLVRSLPILSEEETMKEETELMFGDAIDQEIKAHLQVEEDVTMNRAVQSVGKRLNTVCDRKSLPFRFVLIKEERINAFSGPGGYVYITTGLLNFVENEDELAGVIGHEMAHVCLRHVVKRLKERNASLDSHESLDELARFIVYQKYTAECEQEADRLGLTYARRAGFDPNGLATFFERLYASKPRVVFYGLFERFFQAAVMGPKRIKSIREYIAQMDPPKADDHNEAKKGE